MIGKHIYITGMSGTGKSSIILDLQSPDLVTIDTDYDQWKLCSEPEKDWILDEEKLIALLASSQSKHLVISGCCSNQGNFYQYFDHVILLTASLETILARVAARSTNPYGRTPEERAEIIHNFQKVLPELQKGAQLIFDTEHLSVSEMSYAIKQLLKG